jgi:hypothetical protein
LLVDEGRTEEAISLLDGLSVLYRDDDDAVVVLELAEDLRNRIPDLDEKEDSAKSSVD